MIETPTEPIDALMEKLNEQDARIAALETELANLKQKQYPSFIARSTFCTQPVNS